MKWWQHVGCTIAMAWLLGLLVVFLWYAIAAVELDKQYYRQHPELEAAERAEYHSILRFQRFWQRLLAILTPLVVLGLTAFVVIMVSLRVLKEASVHTYKLGADREIVVHERDLSQAAPAALSLLGKEQKEVGKEGKGS